MPSVFISYSHDSAEHSDRVLSLAFALRVHGIDVELDQFHNEKILDWPRWCRQQMKRERSDFILCVCTTEYQRRVDGGVPPERGKGVYWEGGLLDDEVYDAKGNKRVVPVIFDDEPEASILDFLRGWTFCRLRRFQLDDAGYEQLVRILTGQARVEKNALGKVPLLSTMRASQDSRRTSPSQVIADISRIVKYAPEELIGRESETKLLADAWDKAVRGETKRPHVLTFVALGGEGKTSLVAKWTADLAADDWPGCDAVFAWSFYSQGSRDQAAVSSDLFLAEALAFFGDAEMAGSAQGAFDKGRRLAQLVGERRALLILDGLEPLQYAPTSPLPGELKDQGVAALLKGLATTSHGLCVVTTRYSVPDLKAFRQSTVPEIPLRRLSRDAGVRLLKTLGVKGSDRRTLVLIHDDGQHERVNEFEKLVEEVKGHALTVNLLGSYLRDAHAGDIRKVSLVKLADADEEVQGGHAFNVMDAYATAFKNDGNRGQRAFALLSLIGLFDRPATADSLAAVWQPPAIAGLTEPLIGLSEAQRNLSLKRLEDARLLTVSRAAGSGELIALDAHPLLREHFARRVREERPEAWRAAHRRIYEHLCTTTQEGEQPSLEALQPLYQAVAHGCQAGLQQEACDSVFFARLRRGNDNYANHQLGAYGSELGAVANFFASPWKLVSPALTESDQAWMLAVAAFDLRALGRLSEVLDLMRAALKMRVELEDWRNARTAATNLSEQKLLLGDVAGAVEDAEESVTYAERRVDADGRIISRTTRADALHQAGRRAEALALFREAEKLQVESQPAYTMLYSLQGFNYCDLLLAEAERAAWQQLVRGASPTTRTKADTGTPREALAPIDKKLRTTLATLRAVSKRATQTLVWVTAQDWLLDIALDHLSLGRCALFAAILDSSCTDLRVPRAELEAAVSGLRRAGSQQMIPLGLLTRAWLRSLTGWAGPPQGALDGPESAQNDLDEAWEIAERGPMPLFLADIHLYRARLFLREATYPWESPQHDLAEARRLILKHGYLRRMEELRDAEAALGLSPSA